MLPLNHQVDITNFTIYNTINLSKRAYYIRLILTHSHREWVGGETFSICPILNNAYFLSIPCLLSSGPGWYTQLEIKAVKKENPNEEEADRLKATGVFKYVQEERISIWGMMSPCV
jgi:hypothetical protein